MTTEHKFASIYFGITGILVTGFGLTDILLFIGGSKYMFGLLFIPDDFFRGAWGGLIMVFGGLFMLSGVKDISNLHQFTKVFLGAALVWILAGCDLLAIFCGAVPAGSESPAFFNSFSGFISEFAPPYTPALLLLPFTLVILVLLYRWGFADANE